MGAMRGCVVCPTAAVARPPAASAAEATLRSSSTRQLPHAQSWGQTDDYVTLNLLSLEENMWSTGRLLDVARFSIHLSHINSPARLTLARSSVVCSPAHPSSARPVIQTAVTRRRMVRAQSRLIHHRGARMRLSRAADGGPGIQETVGRPQSNRAGMVGMFRGLQSRVQVCVYREANRGPTGAVAAAADDRGNWCGVR